MSNQFRIGGVYRQRNGEVVRLAPYSDSYGSSFVDGYGSAIAIKDGTPRGWCHLSSGRVCAFAHDDAKFTGDLLPGELTLVNGEWISMTPTLDKIEAEKGGATQEAGIADLAKRIQEHRSAERHRAPLDWNKPTPFDPFKGFEVTDCRTSIQVNEAAHATQRCADFDGLVMKAR
jgi:hypothetical protein